ncbi:AT-rich interactive domain-containing protein 4B [Eumeta japonica]|uniref:AT-rich interactive domain-containing protein 4B n=1 Tax=Eumeta variegata TaxID=151549 RepID=A0A4C1WI64_EUMVA|nr:AT-rich interactive domain-containing protein 4B [Eumeta japonica]
MQGDDPPFLPVGTDVSAKYKGAFCEAKIKKVVRNIKCKVSFKSGGGITIVSEDIIKGPLRVGSTVEIKQDPKKELIEAVITKIQDLFDDGDITTLRRSALCLKSGRHFNESETLDQLPLTHPEHFSTPVIASRRGRRGRAQSEESDGSASGRPAKAESVEREPHVGRVVLVETSTAADRRRPQPPAFPALVVAPTAQIKVKEDYLVRSFTNSRYYTVPKKETREFRKGSAPTDWPGVDAALQYLNNGTLPPHWDRDAIFNDTRNTSDDSSDDEPREEKDHFVAQLYKFMDDRGTPLNRNPTIANRDIDLYRLFRVVQKLGGYNRVTNQNQWKTIADKMGFHPVTTTITNLCKQAYKKFLHSFEDFYRKLGVTLVAHPRGARTPPSGRSLIRDRDKQLPTTSSSSSTPNATPQQRTTKERDKDSDKSEADKSEKEDKNEKIEKVEKPEKGKDKPRASDGEDSGDNQPLATAPKIEKEKPPEEKPTAIKNQKSRLIPVKTESQEKRIPKPRRPMISKSESSGNNIITSRASRRPHASTDSDSSGRASRCGITKKMQNRRSQSANSASSGNTIASNGSKRPRKRKSTEQSHSEPTRSAGSAVKAVVGDKLKVYYGPTQSESKVTYEAKVIEISAEGMLRVHYTGWNTRYDEWIKPQRIALNVTQHERTHNKKNCNSRRARAKRTEESSPRSVSSDSDSEMDNKRPPKKSEEKNNSMPRSKTPGRMKEEKLNENEITKPRKRPIRTVSTPSMVSPVKRPRSSIATHQGRDYDLNEIRSELKGLHSVKQEPEEPMKIEMPEKEAPPAELPEPPPEQKELEDVYEFKEPEPFEIELHDEKKKRTHRIFDDISPSKYTSSLSKSLSEEISEDALRTRPLLRSPSLSPFRDYAARDATERNSPEETSKDGLFSLDDDSFHGDGSSGPIFEGFTPAKNQETYSKKNKVSKLRELIDDSPDSPADDEQSSEDERMDIVLKEERESPELSLNEDVPSEDKHTNKSPDHNKEECVDSNSIITSEITIIKEKTPEPETVSISLPVPEVIVEPKEESSQAVTVMLDIMSPVSDIIKSVTEETTMEEKVVELAPKSPKLEPISTLLIDTEEDKSEPDSPARLDVLPEPPPSFLLLPPTPKISERLLEAINSAKRSSASPPPSEEPLSSPKDKSPKSEHGKISPVPLDSIKPSVSKIDPIKSQPKPELTKKSDSPETSESLFGESLALNELIRETDAKRLKTNPVKEQNSPRLSPLNVLERRKSVPDMPLSVPGKNNKVLSDTILKLSSQINQSAAAALPLPTFTPEDHSDSCDSDDSDRRLIIDKVSIDEWASGGSSEASRGVSGSVAEGMAGVLSARAAAAHAGKSPGEWSAGETLLMLEDACKNERKHSANVVVAGNARPAPTPAAVEEDSNISLLLCEETIPGSPAPDAEPAPARHRLHMPFASAPPHHHDVHHNKDDRRSVEVGSVSNIIGANGANGSVKVNESVRERERELGRGRARPRDEEAEGGAWGRGAMLDNTPPTTPDTSPDRTPSREAHGIIFRERESPPTRKDLDDDSHHEPCAMDLEKPHGGRRSRKVSESSSVGGTGGLSGGGGIGRGRTRRRRDTDEQPPLLSATTSAPTPTPAPPLKYNFYVELDPSWDSQTRINLLTSRLNELRKAYHAVKAELAAVDRRRKKLRRKEREAVKAAKAACL